MVNLDGSTGEGGGQILRTALSLAATTGQAFEIVRIRANRPKPGLRPQHLEAVKAAARVCSARVEGAAENSTELRFIPGAVQPGRYRIEIRTAGSAPMVLQTLFLPLSFAGGESSVEIRGGTHVPFSPVYHYLELQWAPWLTRLGYRVAPRLKRCGFYPAGGGEMSAHIQPVEILTGLRALERGPLKEVKVVSVACNLPQTISERLAKRAQERLSDSGVEPRVETPDLPAFGKGAFILTLARCENGAACYSALGAIGKPSEKVADEAARPLAAWLESDAVMDEYMADQLLLPAALVPAETSFTTPCITPHLLTNADVIRRFVPAEIRIEGEPGKAARVSVKGRAIADCRKP